MGISSFLGSSALLPAGLGFRNVLINGDFKVWQRGTSFTVTTGSPYTADRWCVTLGGTANFSASRQTASLDGFQYCLRFQRTASNTNTSALYLSQPVETVNSVPLANKQVSFSFYARAGANFSAASSALNVRIVTGTGTDGNYLVATLTGQAFQLDTTATLTTSWQRFTYSVLIPSGVNQVQPVFFYTPVGTAGAADYYEITGVQLEQNYQPTPFEQRPIGVELALCQRYFWAMAVLSSVPGVMVSGYGNYCYMMLSTLNPVPMRIAPVAGVNPSYPLATYPPYIADFNSNLRTVTAVDMSSPLMVRWTYDSTKLTTGLSLGLNYGDANRTLWLSSEL